MRAPCYAIVRTSRCSHRAVSRSASRAKPSIACRRSTYPSATRWRKLTAADALAFGAIALFVERARDVDRRFQLTDDNAPIVAEICLRLDGIALAIELAAARVRILAPVQIRARLDERFGLLMGGNRSSLPVSERSARSSIGVTICWTSASGRCSAAWRSSVAVSRWKPRKRVMGDGDPDVLGLVEALSDKSLIGSESGGSADLPVRFRLAESIRMHASQKVTDPVERERLLQRTFEWCLVVARQAFAGWATLPSDRWQSLYEPESRKFARRALARPRATKSDRGRARAGRSLAASVGAPRAERGPSLDYGRAPIEYTRYARAARGGSRALARPHPYRARPARRGSRGGPRSARGLPRPCRRAPDGGSGNVRGLRARRTRADERSRTLSVRSARGLRSSRRTAANGARVARSRNTAHAGGRLCASAYAFHGSPRRISCDR